MIENLYQRLYFDAEIWYKDGPLNEITSYLDHT